MSVLDDILKIIQGRPDQGGLYFPPTVLPPMYNFMASLGPTIAKLFNTPLPTYQGNIDPGMSPTMKNFMQMMQANAVAPPNSALQGAQGALGRYSQPGAGMMGQGDIASARNALMRYQNPRWMNPSAALQGGQMTNYFSGMRPQAPPQSFGGGGGPGGIDIQAMLQSLQGVRR